MFDHAFTSYTKHAFPADEIYPIKCKPRHRKATAKSPSKDLHELILGNYSLTMVDALDTLVILNRTDEFVKYATYIMETLSFDRDIFVSVFEVNIRILGGLLSAHVL
jgi:hypothetical protein